MSTETIQVKLTPQQINEMFKAADWLINIAKSTYALLRSKEPGWSEVETAKVIYASIAGHLRGAAAILWVLEGCWDTSENTIEMLKRREDVLVGVHQRAGVPLRAHPELLEPFLVTNPGVVAVPK